MKQIIDRIYKFRNKINFDKNYDFSIPEIWREAFSAAKPFWIQLLIADFIFLVFYSALYWMPIVAYHLPFLKSFQFQLNLQNQSHQIQLFYAISKMLWPYLYNIFIAFPIYLGMNLMSLRAAYQRPVNLRLLSHYFSLRWWLLIVNLLFLTSLIVVPTLLFMGFFAKKAMLANAMLQYHIVAIAIVAIIALLAPWFSMTINLVFAARQNIADAINLSWQAVKKHPVKIYAMLLLWFLCQRLGGSLAYITDIVLLPPSYLAWALLYRRIYGEQGLVE